MKRVILHADMNNCFASIEMSLNPSLKNKAVAVCGSTEDRHGIVLAKSEKAKEYGVKTGDVIWQAKNKCPGLIIVKPHYDEYLKYSRRARKIYYEYTNQVEPFGLDECWLDVSGSLKLFGTGEEIADQIRKRIKEELGITVSVGVSFNKIFAKIGSDIKKPDATTIITEENFKKKIWPLDVDYIIGIGNKTRKKLNNIGIFTIGHLANTDPEILRNLLGINGLYLFRYANGLDKSEVKDLTCISPVKSIGHGITCTEDLKNNEEVDHVFKELSFSIAKRLYENNLKACGVSISIRDNRLFTRQFQTKLEVPTESGIIIAKTAYELFINKYKWDNNIRSLSIRAIDLSKDIGIIQTDMFYDFKYHEKREKLDTAIYKIRKKYGDKSLTFASLMGDIKIPQNKSDICTLPNIYN